MGNTSFWVVEGMLCVPLGLLVWASQHVYNSLHPSRRSLLLGPVLLFLTCLMATCLFLAAALSAPDWRTRWSEATLWQALSVGSGLAILLVLVCANLARMVRARRASDTQISTTSREQEDLS